MCAYYQECYPNQFFMSRIRIGMSVCIFCRLYVMHFLFFVECFINKLVLITFHTELYDIINRKQVPTQLSWQFNMRQLHPILAEDKNGSELVQIQTSRSKKKILNGRHKQRSDQHTLACQKDIQKMDKFWEDFVVSSASILYICI